MPILISSSKNQKGFANIILVIALVVIVALGGGYYLGYTVPKPDFTTPKKTDTEPAPSTKTTEETAKPTLAAEEIKQEDMVINSFNQAPCNEVSCANIATIIINGVNFASNNQAVLIGQKNNKNYTGKLNGINSGGTQIIFDFIALPCQSYKATISYPEPDGRYAYFMFTPLGC